MNGSTDTKVDEPHAVLEVALDRYLDEDARASLRICGGLLELYPRFSEAWFVAGLASAATNDVDRAALALHVAFHLARREGRMALATAAAHELGAYGDDTLERLSRLAQYFLEGKGPSQPPARFTATSPIQPWDTALSAEEVATRLEALAKQPLPDWVDDASRRPTPKRPWADLDARSLAALLHRFSVTFARQETRLIEEGSEGHEAFLIAAGSVEVWRQPESAEIRKLATLGAGELFGEMAIVTRSFRTANVSTTRSSVLLVASLKALDEVAEEFPAISEGLARHARHRILENLLKLSPVLSVVSAQEHNELLSRFEPRTFRAGERIVSQDDSPEGLHVLALGQVRVCRSELGEDHEIATLGIGDVVGEIAVVLRCAATANVTALTSTVTLFLPRERFLELVEGYPLVLRELYALALRRTEENSAQLERHAATNNDVILV